MVTTAPGPRPVSRTVYRPRVTETLAEASGIKDRGHKPPRRRLLTTGEKEPVVNHPDVRGPTRRTDKEKEDEDYTHSTDRTPKREDKDATSGTSAQEGQRVDRETEDEDNTHSVGVVFWPEDGQRDGGQRLHPQRGPSTKQGKKDATVVLTVIVLLMNF